jgi:hypothetical protein
MSLLPSNFASIATGILALLAGTGLVYLRLSVRHVLDSARRQRRLVDVTAERPSTACAPQEHEDLR